MSKILINKKDEYIVSTESVISSYDRKIVTRLYQPIIGTNSASIFWSLLSELEFDKTVTSERHTFDSLVKLTNVNIDDFRLCLSTLEAVGLVETFKHKEENYFVIRLLAPLYPNDFFNSPLLDSKLLEKLGQEEYDRSKQYFSFAKVINDNFENVSSDWNDVFEFNGNACFNGSTNQVGRKTAKISVNFDFDAFKLRLNQLQIMFENFSKSDLENISCFATSYNISAYDMANLASRALNSDGSIDTRMLKSLCESKTITHKPSTKTQTTKDTGSKSLNKVIESYNSMSSKDFLLSKNNGAPLTLKDINLIDSLSSFYGLSDAVINCILDYALSNNDNKLTKAYIEAIAGSIKRSNIDDSYEAYQYLHKTSKPVSTKPVVETKPVDDNEDDFEDTLKKLEELRKAREDGKN